MNNRVVEWHYAHDADISLGEVHISKVAKIILISLCCLLVVGIGLTIYFRNYIIDSIANPRIQLTTSEKTIEVFDDFNALDYVADADVLNKVEYEINGEVDANTVGTYVIEYISKNNAKTNTATLTVNVVDTTPPTIVLANNGAIQIVRDSDEYNNFNPLDYVLSCSDNYDENPLLSFAPTRLVADEQTSEAKIDFSAVDTANNRTSATLTVFILENYETQLQNEQDAAKIEELQKQLEEQQKQLEEQQKQIDEQKKELEEKQNPTPTPVPTTTPTDPSKPTDPSQGTQSTDTKPTNPKPTKEPTETYYDVPTEIRVTVKASEGRKVATRKIISALQNAGYKVQETGADFTAGIIPSRNKDGTDYGNQDNMELGGPYILNFGDVNVYITVVE